MRKKDSTVNSEFNRKKAYWYDLECSKEEGRIEERKENNYKIVKNLLKENVDISVIQRVTQLSLEEIKKIQLQL